MVFNGGQERTRHNLKELDRNIKNWTWDREYITITKDKPWSQRQLLIDSAADCDLRIVFECVDSRPSCSSF